MLGEEDQNEKEDQAGAELDSRNDTMDDSIHDESVDVPQGKLVLLSVAVSDSNQLIVDH